jgi:hypothetical protein
MDFFQATNLKLKLTHMEVQGGLTWINGLLDAVSSILATRVLSGNSNFDYHNIFTLPIVPKIF